MEVIGLGVVIGGLVLSVLPKQFNSSASKHNPNIHPREVALKSSDNQSSRPNIEQGKNERESEHETQTAVRKKVKMNCSNGNLEEQSEKQFLNKLRQRKKNLENAGVDFQKIAKIIEQTLEEDAKTTPLERGLLALFQILLFIVFVLVCFLVLDSTGFPLF